MQKAKKMKRGRKEELYVSEDQVVVMWKDSAPVYMASNIANNPLGNCTR